MFLCLASFAHNKIGTLETKSRKMGGVRGKGGDGWLLGELVEMNKKLIQAEFIRQIHTLEFHLKVVEYLSTR